MDQRTISSVRFENEMRDMGLDDDMVAEATAIWDENEAWAMSNAPHEDAPFMRGVERDAARIAGEQYLASTRDA